MAEEESSAAKKPFWKRAIKPAILIALGMEEANHLIETGQKAYVAEDFPNATGSTERPKAIFKE